RRPAVVFPPHAQVQRQLARDLEVVLRERRVFADAPVVRIGRTVGQQAIGKVDEIGGWNKRPCQTIGLVGRKAAVAQHQVSQIPRDPPALFTVRLRPVPLDALRVESGPEGVLAVIPGNLFTAEKALLNTAGCREKIPSRAPCSPWRT